MTDSSGRTVRTRFAPSPSGDLHVGNIRTALYAWAHARHTGGTFVFRIEDTDRSRVTDEYIHAAIESMRWLGLDWDEGPEVGGDHGPYLQSERMHLYREWAQRFLDQGDAYHCYCSPEELEDRREEQRKQGLPPGYDGHCRELSEAQVAEYRSEGRAPVVRFRMPEGSTTFDDLIRGEVRFDHVNVPDFVLVRADGYPLYTLAVAVDDVLMQITDILRGDDLLSSTPRQLAVYRAMGVASEDVPRFGHLPFVMGADNTKLSKRNGEVSIAWYRQHGFLPEALTNYLALLGWSPGGDREDFTLEEMVREFDVSRVNANPARFDMKKLEAINGDKIRALAPEDFVGRILPFLQSAGLVSHEPTDAEMRLVTQAAPLIQERMGVLTESVDMLGFLLVDEDHFTVDDEAAGRSLTGDSRPVLEAAVHALEATSWDADTIQQTLRSAIVDGLGIKPKHAFGPVRVAVTGRRVSPPLFESMELLGRERSLRRLGEAVASLR
ncbi:MAG: glutamate--tRNA ligase [Actinomycetota bacterium]|nr:glutamate--tRNA ligase [Actinomycetota bacterium]